MVTQSYIIFPLILALSLCRVLSKNVDDLKMKTARESIRNQAKELNSKVKDASCSIGEGLSSAR